jgi:hypothetical protein
VQTSLWNFRCGSSSRRRVRQPRWWVVSTETLPAGAQPYGYGPGYGMMGGGYGPGYGMMGGYGPGHGMMGGWGGGYGPGWMRGGGGGYGMGPGMMYGWGYGNEGGNLNLSVDQVKTYLQQMIRNPNLKVGDVKEKDG